MASSSSELGRRLTSSVDLSAESRPGGSGTASRRHHRQQLANTTADEMLNGSYSALGVDSGTHNRRTPLLKQSPSSKASSSYSSNTKPTTKAEDDDDFYFVTSDDIGKIPTYILLLLAQAKRSRLNASDISRRSSSVGLVPGTLGIQCRHCCGKRGSGTYFPPNAPKLSRGSAPCLHSHLQRCEACPKIIKAALQKERNRAVEGANDGDAEGVGEHNQQQHWQLLFDRIGDESFDGGDGNSRAVVKAHLSKLLGIKDGDGKRKEEPAVVKTRTASQVDGDMNASAPAPVAAVAATVTTDLAAASSNGNANNNGSGNAYYNPSAPYHYPDHQQYQSPHRHQQQAASWTSTPNPYGQYYHPSPPNHASPMADGSSEMDVEADQKAAV